MINNRWKWTDLLLFLFLVMQTAACKKDWLDEKGNKRIVIPSKLDDYQAMLDHTILLNSYLPAWTEIASDGHYVTDAYFNNNASPVEKDIYTWTKTSLHKEIAEWNASYQRVLVANTVIEGLKNITPANEREKQRWNDLRGQALVVRARTFFEIAQIFAPPFEAQTAGTDLGIVLRTSSDITVPSVRSTVKQTYEQIIDDLKEAIELLPPRPQFLTRASATAAFAYLARTYLSMSDYANAFVAADECLKLYGTLLDYNDVPSTATSMGLYNKEVLMHTSMASAPFVGLQTFIEQSLFDSYHPSDLRKTRFFRQKGTGITFKGTYNQEYYFLFNGPATDEMYLTRAECYARSGRTTAALKDLNDLLVKRWDKNVLFAPVTADNPDEALILILKEREKELLLRGIRWSDLRRLNKDPRFEITIKRIIEGIEYVLNPNSNRYALPIPDDIIQQTGLKQNPGWN